MLSRRELLFAAGASALVAASGRLVAAPLPIATKPLPGSDDNLPVIGLGNSNAFRKGDLLRSAEVLERLRNYGGRYVDASGDSRFVVAEVASKLGFFGVFPGTYFDLKDEEKARREAKALAETLGRDQLDVALCYTDQLPEYLSVLKAMKADGLVRRIGTARHRSEYYPAMIALMEAGDIDMLQVNYSMLEPEAEERVLPAARDNGVAVLTNRPFINGQYFQRVRDHVLPPWADEIDCESWAQFSLKFIVSHPAVTCALTETENPRHAEDNLRAGLGRLPNPSQRQAMRDYIVNL